MASSFSNQSWAEECELSEKYFTKRLSVAQTILLQDSVNSLQSHNSVLDIVTEQDVWAVDMMSWTCGQLRTAVDS